MSFQPTPNPAQPSSLSVHISSASPCSRCYAACCRQNGHEFAALLAGDEVRRFAAFSTHVMLEQDGRLVGEHVLPYVDGKCQFLGDDNGCTIYDDRPAACRAFECAPSFNQHGPGAHGVFLQRNPRVLQLFTHHQPEVASHD